MKHILLHYLDYCNCTQPFTLTIDDLRVRFPTTDALEIIKNVLAMKSEYFIHEDYGMYGYEEQYIYGDISVNVSKDSSICFCLYEKEKEQKSKGIKIDIKNRFEIRLKNGKAEQTIEQLVFSRNPEQTIASLILTQIDFPDYIL